jgi:hypothetical protein
MLMKEEITRLKTAVMRFLRVATGYKMPDYKQKEGILKEV